MSDSKAKGECDEPRNLAAAEQRNLADGARGLSRITLTEWFRRG